MQSKCTCRSVESQTPPQPQPPSHPPQQLVQTTSDRKVEKEPIELCDLCRYHSLLPQLHSMPDMLFNNNLFRLEHSSGVGVEFNPLDALRLVEETSDPLKVAVADGWQSARADCPFAKHISRPFDWTFTTNYRGTLLSAIKRAKSPTMASKEDTHPIQHETNNRSRDNYGGQEEDLLKSTTKLKVTDPGEPTNVQDQGQKTAVLSRDEEAVPPIDAVQGRLSLLVEETNERIDVNKLKVKEEILFYDDITLYEDELADHGTAQYSVKVRVMPSSLFILARYYLRIDGVMARINDTRIYHDLKQNYVLREYTNREAKLSSLKLPMSTIVNPSELMNHLPLIEKRCEKLILPKAASK